MATVERHESSLAEIGRRTREAVGGQFSGGIARRKAGTMGLLQALVDVLQQARDLMALGVVIGRLQKARQGVFGGQQVAEPRMDQARLAPRKRRHRERSSTCVRPPATARARWPS